MATIELPSDLMPSQYGVRPVVTQWMSRSPTGKPQMVTMPGSYWVADMQWPGGDPTMARRLEALVATISAGHILKMSHPTRPAPAGTLRGAPVTSGAHSRWAEAVTIAGTAGATLLAGDLIGIGGYVYMVRADATLSGGTASVAIVPPLRKSAGGGTTVQWDAPAFFWRSADLSFAPITVGGHVGPISISFEES